MGVYSTYKESTAASDKELARNFPYPLLVDGPSATAADAVRINGYPPVAAGERSTLGTEQVMRPVGNVGIFSSTQKPIAKNSWSTDFSAQQKTPTLAGTEKPQPPAPVSSPASSSNGGATAISKQPLAGSGKNSFAPAGKQINSALGITTNMNNVVNDQERTLNPVFPVERPGEVFGSYSAGQQPSSGGYVTPAGAVLTETYSDQVAKAQKAEAVQKEYDANRSPAQMLKAVQNNNTTWDLPRSQQVALAGSEYQGQQKTNADTKQLAGVQANARAHEYTADKGLAGNKYQADQSLAGHKYTADQSLKAHELESVNKLAVGKSKSAEENAKNLTNHIGKYVSAGYSPEGAQYAATKDILTAQGVKPVEISIEHTSDWEPGTKNYKPGQYKILLNDSNKNDYGKWVKIWNDFNKTSVGKPGYQQGQRVLLDALSQIGGIDAQHLVPKQKAKQDITVEG